MSKKVRYFKAIKGAQVCNDKLRLRFHTEAIAVSDPELCEMLEKAKSIVSEITEKEAVALVPHLKKEVKKAAPKKEASKKEEESSTDPAKKEKSDTPVKEEVKTDK